MSECHCASCKLDDLITKVGTLTGKVDKIMGLVQVDSDALVALDKSLDDVATSLAAKINGLALPAADLAPLLADVDALAALAAPPPATP